MGRRKSRKKVLVVDDDPTILEVFDLLLSDAGYDVELAENGRSALTIVERSRPDLIMLDLMMPVMNGWDVMHTLRTQPESRSIPVIILSADQNVESKANELQAEDYCSKPFDVDDVMSKVERLLESGGYYHY